jgi:hypothetical protein
MTKPQNDLASQTPAPARQPALLKQSQFAACLETLDNAMGVKPRSKTSACLYNNPDHAGTSENMKSYAIGGRAAAAAPIGPVPGAALPVPSCARNRRKRRNTQTLKRLRM